MKLLLKSAVIAFSAIGIVLSLHTISYAADSSTANIANAPDITSGNSATTDNDTAHNIGITVSVNNNGSVSDYTKNLTDAFQHNAQRITDHQRRQREIKRQP